MHVAVGVVALRVQCEAGETLAYGGREEQPVLGRCGTETTL